MGFLPAANLQEVDNLSPSPGYEAGPPTEKGIFI